MRDIYRAMCLNSYTRATECPIETPHSPMGQNDLPTLRHQLSDRLRFARRNIAGLGVAEAAHHLNSSRRTLCRWESGQPPRFETLHQIAHLYAVRLNWLLTGEGPPTE